MAPTRVEFSTYDGTLLRGNLYLPEQQNAPVIIVAVGLTFLKEHVGELPDNLQKQGYAVLVFDPRNWGSSDGLPRQEVNLYQQSDDVSDAITFMRSQTPSIDPDRICLFGVGHGGGVMAPVAATDPRIKTLVLAMPFISGRWDSQAWPKGHKELLWEDRATKPSGKAASKDPVYVPIFPKNLEEAKNNPTGTVIGLPQIVTFHEIAQQLSDAAGTPWENKVTIQSLFHQRRWEPTSAFPQITIPTLYITAKRDEFTPHRMHTEAYEKITSRKELYVLEAENLEAVGTPKFVEKWVGKLLDFLKANM